MTNERKLNFRIPREPTINLLTELSRKSGKDMFKVLGNGLDLYDMGKPSWLNPKTKFVEYSNMSSQDLQIELKEENSIIVRCEINIARLQNDIANLNQTGLPNSEQTSLEKVLLLEINRENGIILGAKKNISEIELLLNK